MPHIICNKNFERNKNYSSAKEIIDYALKIADETGFTIIVPTIKQAKQLSFKFIREFYAIHGKACAELKIFTLEQFVKSLFLKLYDNRNFHFISDSYQAVLIEEAMMKAELEFYGKSPNDFKFSVVARISGVINGLKEDGISHEALMMDALSGTGVTNSSKLMDIAKIYKEYNKFLGDRLIDLPSALQLVNEKLTNIVFSLDDARGEGGAPMDILSDYLIKDSVIFCEGFTDLKKPEIEFLSLIGKLDSSFAIAFDFHDGKGPLFGNIREIIENFREQNFSIIPKYTTIPNNEFSQKEFLRESLFELDPLTKSPELAQKIKIIRARTKQDEVRFAAKLIKNLVADGKAEYHEISIVSRNPGAYAEIIRELFHNERIPVNVTDRYGLSKSPVATAVFSIINLVAKGYGKDDVISSLSNPLFNIAGLLKLSNNWKDKLVESLVVSASKLRITGGRKRGGSKNWTVRLRSAIKIYEKNIEEGRFPIGSQELKDIEHYLAIYHESLKIIENLVAYLGENYKNLSINEYVAFIRKKIIEETGLVSRIRNDYLEIKEKFKKNKINDYEFKIQCEEIEKNSRALDAILDVLDETAFVLNDLYGDRKFTFEELTSRLEIAVKSAKYQVKEKENIGVLATSIEQTRGLDFKISFLLGAVDGEFPLGFSTDTFLGKSIPGSEERHLRSEQIAFYQFLTQNADSPERKFFVTYPAISDDDSESSPSSFISFLEEISYFGENKPEIDLQSTENEYHDKIDTISSISNFFNNIAIGNINDAMLIDALNYYSLLNAAYFVEINSTNKSNYYINTLNSKYLAEYLNWLNNKSYSVTEFEDYAKCSYLYFAKRILKIRESSEDDPKLSAIDLGNFLHVTAMRFYLELQTRMPPERSSWIIPNNTTSLPLLKPVEILPEKRAEYLELLISIAREEITRIKYEHPYFEIEEARIFGTEEMPGLLEYWLSAEIYKFRNLGWEFYPSLFEMAFTDRVEPGSFDAVDVENKFRLNGRIDRVEINKTEKDSFGFLIADYKTTKSGFAKLSAMQKGHSFQMPLYTYAANKLLNEKYLVDSSPEKAVYYAFTNSKSRSLYEEIYHISFEQLKPEAIYKGKNPPRNHINISELVDSSIEMASEIIDKLASRNFPVDPLPTACTYCDFKPLCRINEKNK